MIGAGAPAPTFELPDQDGEPVTLEALRDAPSSSTSRRPTRRAATAVCARRAPPWTDRPRVRHDHVAGELLGAELRDRRAMLVHLARKPQDRGLVAGEERKDDLLEDLRETLDPAALGLDLFDDRLDVERHRFLELLFE